MISIGYIFKNLLLASLLSVLFLSGAALLWAKSQHAREVVEATESLRTVYEASVVFVHRKRYVSTNELLPPQFPPSSPWIPSQECWRDPCSPERWRLESRKVRGWLLDSRGKKAQEIRPWQYLRLRFLDPLHFQYRYTSRGTGTGASFTIEARGGRSTLYHVSRSGTLGPDGRVIPSEVTISRED